MWIGVVLVLAAISGCGDDDAASDGPDGTDSRVESRSLTGGAPDGERVGDGFVEADGSRYTVRWEADGASFEVEFDVSKFGLPGTVNDSTLVSLPVEFTGTDNGGEHHLLEVSLGVFGEFDPEQLCAASLYVDGDFDQQICFERFSRRGPSGAEPLPLGRPAPLDLSTTISTQAERDALDRLIQGFDYIAVGWDDTPDVTAPANTTCPPEAFVIVFDRDGAALNSRDLHLLPSGGGDMVPCPDGPPFDSLLPHD